MVTETKPEVATKDPLPRVFIADNQEIEDPDPALPIEDVRRILADYMLELHNCDVHEEDKDGKHYVAFIKRVGTKGHHESA